MTTRTTLSILAAAGLLAASACAAPDAVARRSSSSPSSKTITIDSATNRTTVSGVADGREYRVVVENGKVAEAALNGEKVPSDRVRLEDGHVRILDAQGQEVISVPLPVPAGDGGARVVVGEAAAARPVIGVTMGEIDWPLAEQVGVNPADVVLITGVSDGFPADKAGLKRFDIVTKIDGAGPVNEERLSEAVRAKKAGDILRLTILRKGQPQEIAIAVEERKAEGMTFFRQNATPEAREAINRALAEARTAGERARRAAAEAGRAGAAAGQELRDRMKTLSDELRMRWQTELAPRFQRQHKALAEMFEQERDRFQRLLDNLKLSDEQLKAFEDWIDRLGDAIAAYTDDIELPEIHLFGHGGDGSALVVPSPPTPPAQAPIPPDAPPAPVPGRNLRDENRRLEERIARMEEMLRKLTEQKAAESAKPH